jgi:hypothetical protein
MGCSYFYLSATQRKVTKENPPQKGLLVLFYPLARLLAIKQLPHSFVAPYAPFL